MDIQSPVDPRYVGGYCAICDDEISAGHVVGVEVDAEQDDGVWVDRTCLVHWSCYQESRGSAHVAPATKERAMSEATEMHEIDWPADADTESKPDATGDSGTEHPATADAEE